MENKVEITDEDRANAALVCKAYRSVRRDPVPVIAELFAKVRAATSPSPLTEEQAKEKASRAIDSIWSQLASPSASTYRELVGRIASELMAVATVPSSLSSEPLDTDRLKELCEAVIRDLGEDGDLPMALDWGWANLGRKSLPELRAFLFLTTTPSSSSLARRIAEKIARQADWIKEREAIRAGLAPVTCFHIVQVSRGKDLYPLTPEQVAFINGAVNNISRLIAKSEEDERENERLIKLSKRIYGTIRGDVRAYHDEGDVGSNDKEPWVVEEESGQHWSCYDVQFIPDRDRVLSQTKFIKRQAEDHYITLSRQKRIEEGVRAELALREQRISQLQALHSNDTEALQHEVERLRKANEEVWEQAIAALHDSFPICDGEDLKEAIAKFETARQSRGGLTE